MWTYKQHQTKEEAKIDIIIIYYYCNKEVNEVPNLLFSLNRHHLTIINGGKSEN
jgi:hypothetical protein